MQEGTGELLSKKEDGMKSDDREYVAAVINFFWQGLAQPHSVNENSAKVMYEALTEAQSCTASIDLVPRPTYTPDINYIIKQYRVPIRPTPILIFACCLVSFSFCFSRILGGDMWAPRGPLGTRGPIFTRTADFHSNCNLTFHSTKKPTARPQIAR